MKRILLCSDWHCGHRYGLAHPEHCVNKHQLKGWEFFDEGIKKYAPFDVVMLNGDLIDGRGWRKGGCEEITTNREEQSDMAIKVGRHILHRNKKDAKFFFTIGTPYHTGEDEDWENMIAKSFSNPDGKKNISETLVVNVDDVIFQLRHETSGGGLPQSRGTGIKREALWRFLKEENGYKEANVLVRSHVHYFHRDPYFFKKTLQILPALQLWSSWGEKRCNGMTDYGFVVCDVEDGKILRWHDYFTSEPIIKETYLVA